MLKAILGRTRNGHEIEYLEKRARSGSREKLLAVLNRAPDVEPPEFDRL